MTISPIDGGGQDLVGYIRRLAGLETVKHATGSNQDQAMRLILAILLPWLQFFTIARPIAGLVCLLLQITIIGWLPASIWSVYALSQFKTDQKINRLSLR